MILNKANLIQIIISLCRGIIVKLVYFRKLKNAGLLVLGRKNRFIIGKKAVICIGRKLHTEDYVEIQSQKKIILGNSIHINRYSRIVSYDRIEIGNNVLIAQNVAIIDHDHKYFVKNNRLVFKNYNTAPIVIEDNVWIGDKCTILKGVTIGSNVVIGANSLVKNNIPSNCIAAGVPCKIIKRINL